LSKRSAKPGQNRPRKSRQGARVTMSITEAAIQPSTASAARRANAVTATITYPMGRSAAMARRPPREQFGMFPPWIPTCAQLSGPPHPHWRDRHNRTVSCGNAGSRPQAWCTAGLRLGVS
jgi:hypothetical protein